MIQRLFCLLALALPLVAAPQDPSPQDQGDPPTRAQAQAHMEAGDWAGAAAAFGQRFKANPSDGEAIFLRGYCLHMAGDLQAAHDAHLEATTFEAFAALANYNHACVHALWGQPDPAFQALEVAYERGFRDAGQVRADADLASLREDPRFAAYLRKLASQVAPRPAAAPRPIDLTALPNAQRFDFLRGTYTVTVPGQDAPESLCAATPMFGGNALRTVLRDPGSDAVRTESTYFPTDSGWRMVWLNAKGNRAVLEGGLVGGDLVMTTVTVDGQRSASGRARFTNVTAAGFDYRWEVQGADGQWSETNAWTYRRQSGAR